ncbi:MAG: hypothetical protein JXR73_05345 [Candidatus Omnitrophica bacterium]|nr:hypothetical protein [Candidatus Omnitrophota bacterium]
MKNARKPLFFDEFHHGFNEKPDSPASMIHFFYKPCRKNRTERPCSCLLFSARWIQY